MNARQFRFGAAGSPTTGAEWVTTVRQAADLGFQTVLMPDGLQLPAPFSSLAMAAAVADIRVGTFVAAAPLRTPRQAAWEAHTLTVLTDGRFEFGIGTGRPVAEQQTAEVGLRWGTARERREQVIETLDLLRELDGERRTPIMLAAGGPKALCPGGRTSRHRLPSQGRHHTSLRGRSPGPRTSATWPAPEPTTSSSP